MHCNYIVPFGCPIVTMCFIDADRDDLWLAAHTSNREGYLCIPTVDGPSFLEWVEGKDTNMAWSELIVQGTDHQIGIVYPSLRPTNTGIFSYL